MSSYPLVVLVHVLGTVGIFAAIGVEVASLERLRRATTPQEARLWLGLLALPERLGPMSMVMTLVSGVWLMAAAWGRQPWLASSIIGLVGMGVLGGVVTLRRTRRLRGALVVDTGSDLTGALRSLLSGGALTASLRLRIAIGVGILGLMTLKPDAAGSWLMLAAAAAAGLIASMSSLTARRSRQGE